MLTGSAPLDLLLIAVPVTVCILWWNGSRARELAILHARSTCQKNQLQFLDQTVMCVQTRSVRSSTGRYCFERTYRFEFTNDGRYRDSATVTMQGHHLKEIIIPWLRDAEGNRVFLH